MAQTWTEKHLKYCIAQRLTPTAIKLYQWLLGEIQEGYTEVVDLRDFQKMVAKQRGKAHDFRIIQSAVERLAEAGILKTCKKYSNFLWKWTIRPINRLLYPLIPKPKIYEKRSQIPNLAPSNSSDPVQGVLTTTTDLINKLPEELVLKVETNLDLCEQAGIFYDPTDVPEIMLENPEDIKAAIAYYQEYSSRKIVKNPPGFLRKCLELRWWEKKQAPSFTAALIALTKYLGVPNG